MTKQTGKRERPGLLQELVSVLGIFAAFFVLICLAGFSLPDSASYIQPLIWGGKIGHFFARVMMSFMGFSSFWLVVLLFCFSLQLFSPKASFERLPQIFAGCTGILIASSGLLAATGSSEFHIFGRIYPVGGYIGDLLYLFLSEYFGNPGAVLFFLSLLLISLMVSVEFSPYIWVCNMADGLRTLWELLMEWREARFSAAVADGGKSTR